MIYQEVANIDITSPVRFIVMIKCQPASASSQQVLGFLSAIVMDVICGNVMDGLSYDIFDADELLYSTILAIAMK